MLEPPGRTGKTGACRVRESASRRRTGRCGYLRFKLTERVSAWGLAGFGTGDMTLAQDARTSPERARTVTKTDIGMRMGAVGARGALLEQDEAGGMDLALKADAFLVRMDSEQAANSAATETDASRVRLVLDQDQALSQRRIQ